MRKQQLTWVYKNNIRPNEIPALRDKVFIDLVKELKNVSFENYKINFYTGEINIRENEKIILKKYEFLRNLFDLNPVGRLPQKKVSSLLLRLLRVQKYNINKSIKYYNNGGKSTTRCLYTATLTSLKVS